jgi:hypothetical protein
MNLITPSIKGFPIQNRTTADSKKEIVLKSAIGIGKLGTIEKILASISYNPSDVTVDTMNEEINKLGYSLKEPMSHDHHTLMNNEHGEMDHSQHLGLDQSKEEKLKELNMMKLKVDFVLPHRLHLVDI